MILDEQSQWRQQMPLQGTHMQNMHMQNMQTQNMQAQQQQMQNMQQIPLQGMHMQTQNMQAQQHKPDKKNGGDYKIIIRFLVKLALTCLIVWGIFNFVFGIARMEGQNMYPRVMDGDLMMYYRLEKEYYIGDVVTYKINGNRRTARVVAKGGDIVDLSEKGQLIVNGNVQDEEIFYTTEALSGGVTFPYTVEQGGYFLLCDYRTISLDSRDYGAVMGSDIDGKVISILRRREI